VKQQIAFARRALPGGAGRPRPRPPDAAAPRQEPRGDWRHGGLISDETLDPSLTATSELLAKLRRATICDRTQLYPAFQPSLDDPRLQALIKEMNQAAT
jgi:hypothetical protein